MAVEFLVEDGTGLNNSTSYVDLVFFRQYWENRGIDYTGTSDDTVKVWLNRSTQYIDDNYTFQGIRAVDGQALQWPREIIDASLKSPRVWSTQNTQTTRNIYDKRTDQFIQSNEIPLSLINALCELGNIASTEDDLYGSTKGVQSLSLGKASKSFNSFAQTGIKDYRAVSKYLTGLLITGGILRV